MVNETVEDVTLEILAKKIAQYANEADEKVLETAALIREARKRVEEGEAGDIKWYAWALNNIKLSPSRLRELQRIADAEDPQKELERLRKLTQERVKQHRRKQLEKKKEKDPAPLRNDGASTQAAEPEPERKRLIVWAQTARIEHVIDVLSHIDQLESGATGTNTGRAAESVAPA